MTNSIHEALNQSQQQQSNQNLEQIKQMMNFVRTATNPQAAMQQIIQNNPQVAQLYQMISQSGSSPEQLFYALAKQKGVDPQKVLDALR